MLSCFSRCARHRQPGPAFPWMAACPRLRRGSRRLAAQSGTPGKALKLWALTQAQTSRIHGKCRWVLDRRPCREEADVRFDSSFEDNDEANELVDPWAAVAAIGRRTDN